MRGEGTHFVFGRGWFEVLSKVCGIDGGVRG